LIIPWDRDISRPLPPTARYSVFSMFTFLWLFIFSFFHVYIFMALRCGMG
ncbi:hypothetical protein L9F63_020509, partial [Diploptera punctata]